MLREGIGNHGNVRIVLKCNRMFPTDIQSLKYVVSGVDIDTKDYTVQTASTIHVALDNYVAGLNSGARLSLTHDPQPFTASTLVGWIIAELKTRNLTCMFIVA
jgi:hypothetical protein